MNTKQLAKIFKALSNQNRLELYLQIVKKTETSFTTDCECHISEIIGNFNIGAPTISHHLKELANAELIFTEKKGKYLVCKVNEALVKEVTDLLSLQHKE
ncbi:MAG TPA: transcriptional regulator [Firmicutes bacterium]|jgi:ArsR family transcriptional regulator, arsenate/arsenite/antimonite-responsive transcriptional repressor|nr:transcriptional regulator [Bacillota bacterium]